MERTWALLRVAFVGALLGGLVAIAAVTLIGTGCLALGMSSVHLGIGPVPFMAAYSGKEYGFSSEWGCWLFAPIGAVVALAFELRRRPSVAI